MMTAELLARMRSLVMRQRMFADESAPGGVTGSVTPGRKAGIAMLDAEAIDVAPLDHAPGAVVTLMERSKVDAVLVNGQVAKWSGRLVGYDLPRLRGERMASRNDLFEVAGREVDVFRV
jgi:cytosine/adenosine deaminase-related metal-dependent hydrolase